MSPEGGEGMSFVDIWELVVQSAERQVQRL